MNIIRDGMKFSIEDAQRAMFRADRFYIESSDLCLSIARRDMSITFLAHAMRKNEECIRISFFPRADSKFDASVLLSAAHAARSMNTTEDIFWKGIACGNSSCIFAMCNACGVTRCRDEKILSETVYSPFAETKKQRVNPMTINKLVKMVNSNQIEYAAWRGRKEKDGISDMFDFAKKIIEDRCSSFKVLTCSPCLIAVSDGEGCVLDFYLR